MYRENAALLYNRNNQLNVFATEFAGARRRERKRIERRGEGGREAGSKTNIEQTRQAGQLWSRGTARATVSPTPGELSSATRPPVSAAASTNSDSIISQPVGLILNAIS